MLTNEFLLPLRVVLLFRNMFVKLTGVCSRVCITKGMAQAMVARQQSLTTGRAITKTT
jgi:hypothetical protein